MFYDKTKKVRHDSTHNTNSTFCFYFGLVLLYYTNHVIFKLLRCTLEAASYMDLHDYTAENNCRN